MCKDLPAGRFEWYNADEYTEYVIQNYDEDSEHGALLEVDVEYPIMTRVEHRYLAFLSEPRKLDQVTKLVTTLDDKKLRCAYSNLKTSIKPWIETKKST